MMNLVAPVAAAFLIAAVAPLPQMGPEPAGEAPVLLEPAAGPMSQAEQDRLVSGAEEALASVRTARGSFEQVGPDGSFSTGRFALQRPGKVRFDYDDPVPLLMVSDGTTVALQDSELETTDRVPLGSTPLALLLADRPDFRTQADILDLRRADGQISITMSDRSGETEGTLTLILSEPDNRLRGWRTVDASGGVTSVLLSDLETGIRLNPRLFILRDFDNQ